MQLYERIRERREQLGITQEALAYTLGYKSRTTIAKIEAGKSDIPQSKILAFAKALGTTTLWLMGDDQTRSTSNDDELLHKYRALSPDHQQALLAMLDTLYDLDNKKDGAVSA